MNIKRIATHIITFFLFAGCRNGGMVNSHIPIIDPWKFDIQKVKLSELVDEITCIQLDSTELFAGFVEQIITPHAIFINSMSAVFKYDRAGVFSRKIGSVGQGPEEYNQYHSIAADTLHNRLFVYNVFEATILAYTFDGDFLFRLKIKDLPDTFRPRPNGFYYMNDRFYLFKDVASDHTKHYMWAIVDTLGNVLSCKEDAEIHFSIKESSMYGNRVASPSVNHSVLYWNSFNDTVFRFNADTVTTPYIWAQNKYRLTPQRYSDKEKIARCMIPANLIDSRNYLFLSWFTGDLSESHFCIYDKRRKTNIEVDRYIEDDIYGGISFGYIDYFVQLGSDEYLVYSCLPEDLKNVLLDSDNHRSKAIADTIDEEGNPVIVMCRLKK